ncbi:MAG: Cj0069 family protein [Ramlibacter sp.]
MSTTLSHSVSSSVLAAAHQPGFRVAVLWRGDAQARNEARPASSRFNAVFEALESAGMSAEPAVYAEEVAREVQEQLRHVDGVLVWVDPISQERRRTQLDVLLREVAQSGLFVSGHPDVIRKMGAKEVLFTTRRLGWGTGTDLYESADDLSARFPARLAAGPRVIKQNRGNGGIGVWKVERLPGGEVCVQEARRDGEMRVTSLEEFIRSCSRYFDDGERLVDQPFQARHLDGMIRCYMSGGRVAGFGHQLVRALAPREAGPAGPRLYSGPGDQRFQRLRRLMEQEWTPAMAKLLDIAPAALPVIWDADFLLGPRTPDGEDTYVLCEINASSVFPIPDEAPAAIANTVRERLVARRERSHG